MGFLGVLLRPFGEFADVIHGVKAELMGSKLNTAIFKSFEH